MENILIEGIITTTSNKQSLEFRTENPKKSVYIQADEENAKKLKDFGLREYTSKSDGESFFIVKCVDELKLYFDTENPAVPMNTTINDDNFKTEKPIFMNIVKGENIGNVFYRLSAVLINEANDIIPIQPENPFA